MRSNKSGAQPRALAIPVHARNACSSTGCRDQISRTVVGSLILDSKGVIHCCSEAVAQLAGLAGNELAGRAIKVLIPDFPLCTETQGYNVAFVSFLTASGRGHAATLLKSDGSTLAVEAWTNVLKVNKEYLLCIELRCKRDSSRSERRSEPRRFGADQEKNLAA